MKHYLLFSYRRAILMKHYKTLIFVLIMIKYNFFYIQCTELHNLFKLNSVENLWYSKPYHIKRPNWQLLILDLLCRTQQDIKHLNQFIYARIKCRILFRKEYSLPFVARGENLTCFCRDCIGTVRHTKRS